MEKLKTIILALTATFAISACNNGNQNQQANETNEAQNDTIACPSDSVCHESFLLFAKEQCGLEINLDNWQLVEIVSRDIEMGFTASYHTNDDTDIEAFLDKFLQQCIDASVVKAIGTAPKCKTVAEAREHLITKLMKNENDPAEGYCYKGEIIYVHNGGKVKATINFGKYANNLNTLYFKLSRE